MATFKVTKVVGEPREWSSAKGGSMLTYKMLGSLDGREEELVQINTSKEKAKVPFEGEAIECEVAKDDPTYGKTIKRAATFPGTANPPYQENPDRQASIERQNSLTNAISFCTTKANVLIAAGKPDLALAEVEGKHILQVATYFKKYNSAEISVTMGPEDVARAFGYEKEAA